MRVLYYRVFVSHTLAFPPSLPREGGEILRVGGRETKWEQIVFSRDISQRRDAESFPGTDAGRGGTGNWITPDRKGCRAALNANCKHKKVGQYPKRRIIHFSRLLRYVLYTRLRRIHYAARYNYWASGSVRYDVFIFFFILFA